MGTKHRKYSFKKLILIVLRPFVFVLTVLLSFCLTNRAKRLLCATSLYSYLNRVVAEDMDVEKTNEYLAEINQLFQLTSRGEQALIMPLMLHVFIWEDIDLPDDECLVKNSVQSNCDRLMKTIPRWLRYDPKVMKDDLSIIVRLSAGRYLRIHRR